MRNSLMMKEGASGSVNGALSKLMSAVKAEATIVLDMLEAP